MNRFHDDLKYKMDKLAHFVYRITKSYPRDELFGTISQTRRAALSVILNYIEGYARLRDKVHKNFLEISYGSLKELKYLLHFALVEKYINKEKYNKAIKLADDIGAMLWGIMKKL